MTGARTSRRHAADRAAPLVPLVPDGADPELDAFLDAFRSDGRSVANIQRAIGHHAGFARAFADFSETVRAVPWLTAAEVELVILRVAVRTGCAYPFAHHVAPARAAGVTEPQLEAIWGPATDERFGPEQQLLLRAVDEIELDAGLAPATFEQLSGRATPGEVVGLVALVGFYGLLARLANSLLVPVDEAVRPALERHWPADGEPAERQGG